MSFVEVVLRPDKRNLSEANVWRGGVSMGDDPLRAQLVRILDWEEAHNGFDKAVDGLPSDKRGVLAPGVEHSV